jgi:hypothetical protein
MVRLKPDPTYANTAQTTSNTAPLDRVSMRSPKRAPIFVTFVIFVAFVAY